jgi:hypothetical protein
MLALGTLIVSPILSSKKDCQGRERIPALLKKLYHNPQYLRQLFSNQLANLLIPLFCCK